MPEDAHYANLRQDERLKPELIEYMRRVLLWAGVDGARLRVPIWNWL